MIGHVGTPTLVEIRIETTKDVSLSAIVLVSPGDEDRTFALFDFPAANYDKLALVEGL